MYDDNPVSAFIEAACAPLDDHASGTLGCANAILTEHPEIAGANIYTAAVIGNDASVRQFLAADPASATAKGGPRGWDALTYLCFSRYLQHDPSRSDGFVRAATALLDAGASANSGWFENNHQPTPEWESVLYGAAGVAHHPELTRLLLERGAEPNDNETCYHAPETRDNRALAILVGTGEITADNLSMMLVRKHDWHDYEGAKFLLEHGADPNFRRDWGLMPMHHALARDNALRMLELLLNHSANPMLVACGHTAVELAGREGRSDVLELFEKRGVPIELHGVDRLIAACAMDDGAAVRAIVDREPQLVSEMVAMGGELLAKWAGSCNAAGMRQLLDLGVSASAPYAAGDGYWGIPRNSLAIHVAAWRGCPPAVRLLIERGSPVDVPDANGRTPLALAVRACVDSYWTERRSPESAKALLDAGASPNGVAFPSGYAEVDALLRFAKESSK